MSDAVANSLGAVADFPDCARGVDLWIVDAAELADSGQVDHGELSDEESSRYGRIRAAHVRRRASAVRWALRRLLSRYTGLAAAELQIGTGQHGKPELHTASGRSPVQFNVSHSGALGLIAVAADLPVGVDLELIRPLEHPGSFARTILSERERSRFESLAPAAQNDFLLRTWVAKESALKASGFGLAWRPDRITIASSMDDGAPVRLVAAETGLRWTAACFVPAAGYVAAIALEGDLVLPAWRVFSAPDAHRWLVEAPG